MELNDKSLLDEIIYLGKHNRYFINFVHGKDINIDIDIMDKLIDIHSSLSKKNADLYSQEEKIKELWIKLVDKSIKCLRYFDEREPFKKNTNKKPETYRIEELKSYFDRFSSFEGMLYGSNNKYRDHVIHVFRTWFLGVYVLLTKSSNTRMIDKIELDGVVGNTKFFFNPNIYERLSMWTLISLCHDLGYPLERREEIINKTEKMMTIFFPNANITMTYNNISGVHDESFRNIVKFISSKIERSAVEINSRHKTKYSSRIQSKYYNKIYKSLESFSHGIISAIVLFRSLEYFLESDFSIEGDYGYSKNDASQFYIRREILRAIAMHTCINAYHIKTTTFPFLLILCDELQEWDRRTFKDFYLGGSTTENRVDLNLNKLNKNEVCICESLTYKKAPDYIKLFDEYIKQYEKYKKIFRDGLDTNYRKFSFNKVIKVNNEEIIFEIDISKKQDSKFIIQYKTNTAKNKYDSIIRKMIDGKYEFKVNKDGYFVYRRKY